MAGSDFWRKKLVKGLGPRTGLKSSTKTKQSTGFHLKKLPRVSLHLSAISRWISEVSGYRFSPCFSESQCYTDPPQSNITVLWRLSLTTELYVFLLFCSYPWHCPEDQGVSLMRETLSHMVIYLPHTSSCLQLSASQTRIFRIIQSPGVSMMLKRKDFPLVSGRTIVTGVLLIPTPLWKTGKQDYQLKEKEKSPCKRWTRIN